jgi:hypothetical protein
MICTTAFLSCPNIQFNLRVCAESLERISARFSIRGNVPRLLSQRQLFLARAVYLIERYRRLVDVTSQDFLLIAAALAGQGEFSGSLRFYKRSVRYALDERMKATALRVYGRALIASGSAKAGRRKMLQSVTIFKKLSERVGYERKRMIYEMADTYQRLIYIETQHKIYQHAASDFAIAEQLLEQIQDKGRRKTMKEYLKARKSELAALDLIKGDSAIGLP